MSDKHIKYYVRQTIVDDVSRATGVNAAFKYLDNKRKEKESVVFNKFEIGFLSLIIGILIGGLYFCGYLLIG